MELIPLYAGIILVVLGLRVSYTDIWFGKIRNQDLLWGLCAGLAAFLLYMGVAWMGGYYLDSTYMFQYTWNLVMALIVGYWFWRLGIWSAGDGKLFFVISSIIPLGWYHQTYFSFFPSLVLLLNSILPLMVFIVLRIVVLLLYKQEWKVYLKGFRKTSWTQLLLAFLQFLGLFFIGRMLLQVLFLPLRQFLLAHTPVLEAVLPVLHDHNVAVLIAFFLVLGLRRWLKRQGLLYVLVTVIVLGMNVAQVYLGLLTGEEFIHMFTGSLLVFVIGMTIFRALTVSLLNHVRSAGVLVPELAAGMVPTPHTLEELTKKDPKTFGDLELYPDGLSPEQVQTIQQWYHSHASTLAPEESIEMYTTTAFGPFIVLGAFLTAVLQGALVFLLRGL